jgi:hypothetical protein
MVALWPTIKDAQKEVWGLQVQPLLPIQLELLQGGGGLCRGSERLCLGCLGGECSGWGSQGWGDI